MKKPLIIGLSVFIALALAVGTFFHFKPFGEAQQKEVTQEQIQYLQEELNVLSKVLTKVHFTGESN